MTTFALKGFKGQTFRGSHAIGELEIRGRWYAEGNQPIGDGGVPKWVADLFDSDEAIHKVAISGTKSSHVWTRQHQPS